MRSKLPRRASVEPLKTASERPEYHRHPLLVCIASAWTGHWIIFGMAISEIEGAERVLTTPALAFVDDLTRRFRGQIDELLARRRVTQRRFDNGGWPDFLSETAAVRAAEWRVAPPPADLQDR